MVPTVIISHGTLPTLQSSRAGKGKKLFGKLSSTKEDSDSDRGIHVVYAYALRVQGGNSVPHMCYSALHVQDVGHGYCIRVHCMCSVGLDFQALSLDHNIIARPLTPG